MQQLVEKILGEMRDQGAISFAHFMEYALYCPVYGYYEKEGDTLGRRGDYYTSVSVGPLFGQLLALQFGEWLKEIEMEGLGGYRAGVARESVGNSTARPAGELAGPTPAEPGKMQIVEAGAHKGELARDILAWLHQHQPELVRLIKYCIVEPSVRRQEWQRQTLAAFGPRVRWFKNLEELSTLLRDRAALGGARLPPSPDHPNRRGIRGIIFSNELLDAMPVHRFGWNAADLKWFEWGVTLSEGRFAWTRLAETATDHSKVGAAVDPFNGTGRTWPAELFRALPDGFTIEVCPAASQWWSQAAAILESGKLLAVDYGFEDKEWFSPERARGTLRAYHHHHLNEDVLSNPGEQDLTAHVNFSALLRAGESAALKTEGLFSQEQFLTGIATPVFTGKSPFGQWTAEQTRQFQTLTHPNHLGRSFRVLVQSRNAPHDFYTPDLV